MEDNYSVEIGDDSEKYVKNKKKNNKFKIIFFFLRLPLY